MNRMLNSMHKTRSHIIRIFTLLLLLLMAGATNEAWAAKVTYHILTLPIDPSYYDYHMKSTVVGHRLEAFKIVVDNQSNVELPAHYKSPLATGFTYYKPEDIEGHGGSAISLYDGVATAKGVRYKVKGVDTADPAPTAVTEGTTITTNTAEYYVVYTYNASNTIAQLDGSVNYNIGVKGKGFLSLNRGRNNRPAVIPTAKVDPEMLASQDFSYVDNPGNSIGTYWKDGNNKNKQSDVESQFFFIFKFEGKDPYHIVLRTSYERNITYIEKNEGTSTFVYKWYKGSALMAASGANAYLASDDHIQYTTLWVDGDPNPTNPASVPMTGYFHGNKNIWGTLALLNNTSNTGYVFMSSRTVDGNGVVPGPNNSKYYYLVFDGYNNLKINQITSAEATNNNTVDGIYPLKRVTFKVATPFYKIEPTTAHIVSVPDWVSQYTVENDPIETKYLPPSLRRKYCQYTGKFYSDAACTNEITHFSQATEDPTDGYQVYIGYNLTADIPFKGITPAASYNASTWANATWYELTDEGSTQVDGLKLKYDGTNYFKNDGADGVYDKTTEFAFIGDPYELRVVYRNTTSGNTPYYVGATGTPPTTGTALTASTTATEGYLWELPNDATAGSFLLKKYKGKGNWYWDAGHPDPVAIDYSNKTPTYDVATANAQVVTFNVSNLGYTEGDYILVTAGGTNADQVTVSSEKFYVQSGGTASFTAAIKGWGGSDKTFTLSIQKYNSSNAAQGTASVVTVNQNNSAIVANTVEYSTANSTRVKVLDLPKHDFTYNIVDKSGRIAVKATVSQTIYSPLSLASIPGIIVSPFLYGETVTFYSTYSGGGRGNLSSEITELTAGNAASSTNVYVKYTTGALNAKPIKLSEDEEFNVKLNGHYIYYDKEANVIKTNDSPTEGELSSSEYLWKLRNRDPYAMLIDNMGAREDLSVSGTEPVTVYDDSGTGSSGSRQVGAWVWLNNVALPATSEGTALAFTPNRAYAQQFVAKSSLQDGVYEVMVADGGSVDASTTYYDIGCPEADVVKIYNNTTYAHGHDVLRFVLNQNVDYHYHLIDKAKHELLTSTSKTPDLALPAEYQSPLVATYNFYARDQITIDDKGTPDKADDEYTPTDPNVKLTDISQLYATFNNPENSDASEYAGADASYQKTATDDTDMLAKAKQLTATGYYYFKINDGASYKKINVTQGFRGLDIYVTYEANDVVNFNKGQYMLKFLQPLTDGYYLEDGNDKLTTSKLQAVYPYCNGDGNLNVYGEKMQKEQFGGGANTRPRWVWYFASENSDPYHVSIHSKSTISYNSVSNYTYLTTYVVHFNQDDNPNTKHVVTGGTLPGVASVEPTEYMVLGSIGSYKLMTTQEISDGTTTKRREVTSLEQYWKTYNMLKLDVLGISKSTNEYSDDESTWVVPADKRDELQTKLGERGVGSGQWHSYSAYANATRWNGYNDKSDGEGKKVVENLEHWFQTFDMGNGTFDIESADIPPVLVLLDRHGWEIMRRPLPAATTYPEGDVELAALRVYDSPLVDKYYFYSNATKASGCHKYTLRLQNEKERDQIKVNGEHYSSTSLGDLPPKSATGVVSGGAIQDFYVTYTVKEEYEKNYEYSLDYTETKDANDKVTGYTVTSETGTSQPYLVLQNGRFYKTKNSSSDKESYISKPIAEHTYLNSGNVYDLIVDPHNHGGNDNIIDGSGNFYGNNFWYVKPNINIDEEMGITWGTSISGAEPLSKVGTQVTYKDKSGFDPYNIQLQLVNKNDGTTDGRYLTTHMTSAHLDDGILVGDYTGGSMMITLEPAGSATVAINTSEGYDHTDMRITNQTFMAVSDANGNMQLMPRFDHTLRVDLEGVTPWETKLKAPVDHAEASADDNSSMGPQTTFFVRPQRFHYHIIDNNGREALRYKRGADFYPAITDHFKSPIAKDFTYYTGLAEGSIDNSTVEEWGPAQGQFKKSLTKESMLADAVKLLPAAGTYYYRIGTRGVFTYKKVVVTKGLSEKEITGSFAAANLDAVDCHVYVRYNYDEDADLDADRILEGPWFTVKLAEKDLQADGTLVYANGATQGTGVNLYSDADTPTKPAIIDANAKKWQWKFIQAPTDPSSDYYTEPDPYAIQIFNREANHTTNPSLEPSPMAVGIKVPNANDGADRFALLSHPDGGYALVVAKEYDENYNYLFLNGESMTTSVAATTATESDFNYKAGTLTTGAQVLVNDDVTHNYTYYVITNEKIVENVNEGNKLAITANQDHAEAASHSYAPYLPKSAQTPLLNMDDYLYYGFATENSGTYSVIPQTKLYTLYGLYDDVVYVRYNAYDMDKTPFKVPNKKDNDGSHVVRESSSVDVAMNINGGLPYNIIWYNDNMMQSTDNSAVSDGGSHDLSGSKDFVWYFTENDPYALKIKHKGGKYLDGSTTMVVEASAPTFMLLKKTDYDYGVLQLTGGSNNFTFGDHDSDAGTPNTFYMTAGDPTKYIIFGLSIHDLIYHLVIAKTCPNKAAVPLPSDQYVDIPYMETESGTLTTKRIYGTTQRDLTSVNSGDGTHYAGEKYQLGETLTWNSQAHTYSYDAGSVSIGDELVLPNIFYRPNCTFEFYIEGIYQQNNDTPYEAMNNKYKGLNLKRLMSDDELVGQNVVVNVVYSFDKEVATNTGLDFVTSTNQNLWYTFETPVGETPYLAQYTNAWGLQAKEGRATRYTNDYLWTPLGDVYGFKMYNRYMLKNSTGGGEKMMTMSAIANNQNLLLAQPSTTENPTAYPAGNEIFELISGDAAGYFRVHPVANTSEQTQLYVRRDPTDGYAKLSATPCDWTFGLDMSLMEPYYERAGYVGGLTAAGKTAYEAAVATGKITEIQNVVYNDANIVTYSPGYYRMYNQPGVSGISPVRYASGYLHDIEKTAVTGGVPMHFYSKSGVTATFSGGEDALESGFTVTNATRGQIPIIPTEVDPSTIFYFSGTETLDRNPRSTMQTQGLYVAANANGDTTGGDNEKEGKGTNRLQRAVMSDNSANAITFSLMDIGGAVLLIHDGAAPATRRYLNYDQSNFFQRTATNDTDMENQAKKLTSKGTYYFKIDGGTYKKLTVNTVYVAPSTDANYSAAITSSEEEWIKAADKYDLKYYHDSPTDDAKWCLQPVQKTATAGNGEMPLEIATNQGGDGHYYATFYAPFDVLLPNNDGGKTYYAYFCKTWDNAGLHPTAVPATNTYAEGKFVPAGTPVIIRTTDESNVVTLTLPSTSPTASSITTDLMGTYLEQLLSLDSSHDAYTLGLPFTSAASIDRSTGVVTAPLKESATTGVGFYINATPNKEHNALAAQWQRNNRYVLHNKVYYRATGGGARETTRGVEFVPVIFDDEESEDPNIQDAGDSRVGDGCVYDLLGRKVATKEQVEDGTWRLSVRPGIYIINGKKIRL